MKRRDFLKAGMLAAMSAAAKPASAGISLSGPTETGICAGETVSLTYTLTKGPGQPLSTTFSVSGLPPGITGTFSQTSCKPNCGTTLTLRAASNYVTGSYSFIVRAQNSKDVAMANTNIKPRCAVAFPPPPVPPPSGPIYYVDPTTGNNSDDGLSPATAWQTLGKVNGFAFSPGDTVLFKRGETFSGRLKPTASGSTGNHIIFDAYDVGAAPIISGGSSNGCELNSLHDITLRNLFITTTSDAYALQIEPGFNFDIEDCELVGHGVALRVAGAASGTHDINFLRVITRNALQSGMEITHTAYPGPSNLTFTQCESHDNGSDSTLHQGFYIQRCDNVLLYRCLSHDNAAHGFQIVNDCTNVIMRRCRSYLNGSEGIETLNLDSGANILIDHNLIYDNQGTGIRFASDTIGISLLNNTFVNNGRNGTIENIKFSGSGTSGNILKNNLSVYDEAVVGGGKWAIYVPDTATLSNNTFDYNCWVVLNAARTGQSIAGANTSLATWQSNGADAHGFNSDPLLTSSSDFHLQAGSPCINTGVSVGLTEDFDGVATGGSVNVGAYE